MSCLAWRARLSTSYRFQITVFSTVLPASAAAESIERMLLEAAMMLAVPSHGDHSAL